MRWRRSDLTVLWRWSCTAFYFGGDSMNLNLTKVLQAIEKMRVAERILLVEAIQDSISNDDKSLQLSSEDENELQHRLESFRANPSKVQTWDEIKESLK